MKKKKKPTRQERTRQAKKFLNLLFANEVSDKALISIWTKQGGRHRFFDSCSDAAEYAIERARSKLDVYVGCCLYRNGISKGRGRAEDVVRITALWIDVDCGKKSGFSDKKAGLAWLRNLELPPSMIVDSGGGYHGWWLLTESQGTSAGGEPDLPKNFIKCLQRNAEKSEAKLDSVGDLSRVLRIPGTFNRKQKSVRRVRLLKGKIRRYDLVEIEAFVASQLNVSNATSKPFFRNIDISIQELRTEVQKLTNDRASNYDHWLKVGMGIHSAFPNEEGLDLFIEFSRRTTYGNFDERVCRDKWLSFNSDGGVTVGSVIMMAQMDSGKSNFVRDPHILAREVIAKHYLHESKRGLQYHRSSWLEWGGQAYGRIADDEVRARLNAQVRCLLDELGDRRALTQPQVANIQRAMEGACLVPSSVEIPSWIGEQHCPAQGQLLSMTNGLLDVDAAIRNAENCLIPHTPDLLSLAKWRYAYDADATCREWNRFLRRVLPGKKSRMLLQEFLGYCLISDTSYQKFLVLVGDGANGKSVITDVTSSLLGEDNVTHIPLEQFAEQFSLAQTVGKLANVVSEIGRIKNVAEHNLKAIASGDNIKVERKYHDAFSMKPTIRLIFATNEVPKFHDRSSGIWRRMLLIPFGVSIPEDEQDRTLSARIRKTELPGVLNWALRGLARLRKNDGFTTPQATTDAILKLRAKSSPVLAFILSNFEECECAKVCSNAAYTKYFRSCECESWEPVSPQQFGKEIRIAFPKVKYKQSRSKGERGGYYQGMRKKR